jgi:signal transduction histidine kinase
MMETILLIYNDENFSAGIQQFLTDKGYNVKIVQDAEEAEVQAEQSRPHLIILDALLQKMNGFELCKAFKKNLLLQNIPIIMTSAIYISDEDRMSGIHLGTTTYEILADRCVMKPFEPIELLNQINYLLGKDVEAPYIPQILIVDDEQQIRDLLRITLEGKNYNIQEVVTGKACLNFLSTSTPDLILLDYKLPDISGIDVLKEIRKKSPDVAVILMTAYGDEDIAMHAIEEHVDGYLRKPFLVEVLLAVLTQTLERHRIEGERRRLIAQLRESNREVISHYQMLEQANRDLRALDKLKSEFLANIGHELRTPLNSIIGFTELILQGYSGPINTDQRRQLAMVLSSGNRLLRVLNDVIEVSMLNADQIELKCEDIPISTIINDVIREVRNSAAKKKLTIFMDIEEALPDCYCSREKVKLILYNLLDNAIKFSSSGSIVISAHSTSDLSQYGFYEEYNYATPGDDTLKRNYLVVSVKDQGIGIHRDDYDILFDEFRQVDGSLTREYDGTGLGLAISKKLIELHGGNIWLDSQIGVGTTFYFSLPLSK